MEKYGVEDVKDQQRKELARIEVELAGFNPPGQFGKVAADRLEQLQRRKAELEAALTSDVTPP